MRNFYFLFFVVMTFLSWGLYGPVLHVGQEILGGGHGQKSMLRPLICVGGAYFLIAVLFPLIVLRTKGEKGGWTIGGFVWSFLAGAIGAVGALGIVLAFKFGGKPIYVMPLVFGLAPIINTLVTMVMGRTLKEASTPFYIGILIVAVGAAGVLVFKPSAHKMEANPSVVDIAHADQTHAQATGASDASDTSDSSDAVKESVSETMGEETEADTASQPSSTNGLMVALSVALTALCWGAYGPVLHKGQAKMKGSRLRPFLCVGLAYFVIAVIAPLMMLGVIDDPGSFDNFSGIAWSFAAGATGAIGALGIIYAFNFGGKPLFVMPLVFGFAPVINTFYGIITRNLFGQVSTLFYVSLGMVILGAMMVLVLAPRKPPATTAASK